MLKFLKYSKQDSNFKIKRVPLNRILDLIAFGTGFILLSPIFIIIALAIKCTSSGPVFNKCKRIGQGGRPFCLYKFRTVYVDGTQPATLQQQNNPCFTSVGRFLHHSKLEGLPQLINILRSEMSLVGPCHIAPNKDVSPSPAQYPALQAKPGLISPGLQSPHNTDLQKKHTPDLRTPHKLALNLAYSKQQTVWTDLHLILQMIANDIKDKQLLHSILKLRNRHLFILDIVVISFIPAIALTLHLDGFSWWPKAGPVLLYFAIAVLIIKLPVFYGLGLYKRCWRYAGVNDLTLVFIAVGLSVIILSAGLAITQAALIASALTIPRTIPLIDGLLTGFAIGGSRLSLRGLHYWHRERSNIFGGRRVLVVGAGEAGMLVVQEIRANPQLKMEPILFVDDDPAKIGTHIQGLPVAGSSKDTLKLADQYHIQQVIIAFPSAPLGRHHEIISQCKQASLATYSLPGIYQLLAGHKTVSHLPQIDINQLLHRKPVVTDPTEIITNLQGATVLVTGAGGSIGSELCRQIARCNPASIILLGHGENSIFEIGLDLRLSFSDLTTHSAIVDVRHWQRVREVVKKYRPEIIFHAAAHKHVPFMEDNAKEAVTNNTLGTRNVLKAAEKYKVNHLVLISTDKAVNPTCVMGATKRLAEMLVAASAQRTGRPYMAVRFGNVLGSRGSVIPVFQRQIAAGGPLTVTHPDMYRYFMTIPEAVRLVLHAFSLGQGGEVFVLDMGKPVRILDMAIDLIKLSGLKPKRDIKIVFTGTRPGEKLTEELFLESEGYYRTNHHRIFKATSDNSSYAASLEQVIINLIGLTEQIRNQNDIERLRTLLLEVCHYIDIPQSRPQPSLPHPDAILETFQPPSLYSQPAPSGV